MQQQMERRQFLKSSCNICLLGAAGFALPGLTGCAPVKQAVYTTTVLNNQVIMPLDLFNSNTLQIVRPAGWFYDIAVQKNADNGYQALLMQCTHQENQLTASGGGFTCSLHGSRFNQNGNVLKGPAEERLQLYQTTVTGGTLIIHIPKTP